VVCGLLSLALPVVTVTTSQALGHLGWTFALGVAAVVLGALGDWFFQNVTF
jgi:hypothetical protein